MNSLKASPSIERIYAILIAPAVQSPAKNAPRDASATRSSVPDGLVLNPVCLFREPVLPSVRCACISASGAHITGFGR